MPLSQKNTKDRWAMTSKGLEDPLIKAYQGLHDIGSTISKAIGSSLEIPLIKGYLCGWSGLFLFAYSTCLILQLS